MRRRHGGRSCPLRAAHAGLVPASLVLYDVSTLYFETDAGDGFRESGFSKEQRLEPQITIGLLAGQDGFPLMVSEFEGNMAETKTTLPVIEAFVPAHRLPDVTVVADAGMISEANQRPPQRRDGRAGRRPGLGDVLCWILRLGWAFG
jgi:transposase